MLTIPAFFEALYDPLTPGYGWPACRDSALWYVSPAALDHFGEFFESSHSFRRKSLMRMPSLSGFSAKLVPS